MANKKLNFKTDLLNISHEPIKEGEKKIILSDVLAEAIMQAQVTDNDLVLKFFAWALELKKSGEIALDKVDEEKLRTWILSNGNITLLGKGRLIEIFDKAK